MKKTTFTTGAIAGATALIIAVPVLSQFVSAASSDSSAQSSDTTTSDQQVDSHKGGHVGKNGNREELLTGDSAAKATAAALAAVPGGTIDRVETDAEGDAYEAHMTKADGSHATVKFDANFTVTNIEDGPMGR